MFSVEPELLIAAGVSFVMGVMGYIIARYWIRPIVRYNIIKQRLNHDLKQYLTAADDPTKEPKDPGPQAAEWLKSARRHSMDLVSRYSAELPHWYRLLLTSRLESPAEASGLLTGVSKIKDRQQVKNRIREVQKKLNLKPETSR